MGELAEIDTAIKTGLSPELLRAFANKAMKHGHTRKLGCTQRDGLLYFDEEDLDSYLAYLEEPWPKSPRATRPSIPEAIKKDVRLECHLECAICTSKDNGELAHIEPTADTANNSPFNLILLCPNHHTKYDLGHKPKSNVDIETIRMVKAIKRASRRRFFKYEGNALAALRSVLNEIESVRERLVVTETAVATAALTNHTKNLIALLPELFEEAQEAAARDETYEPATAEFKLHSGQLGGAIVAAVSTASSADSKPEALPRRAEELGAASLGFRTIGRAKCPHCAGTGTIGLMGSLCIICAGDGTVPKDFAAEYDPRGLDEARCPHCEGQGTRGLMGNLCSYCRGNQVVTREMAEEYSSEAVDETPCPHCEGQGTRGLMGNLCSYCGGNQVVTHEMAEEYDADDLDEVD